MRELNPALKGGRLAPDSYKGNFSDLHPPLDRHEAAVEADRCYFCYDAPCMTAWASLPIAILPWGTSTAQVMPARAA